MVGEAIVRPPAIDQLETELVTIASLYGFVWGRRLYQPLNSKPSGCMNVKEEPNYFIS
jgi:hypothetical protein